MIRTILVDDETMILKGLTKIVDWEGQGFEILGTFDDSREALQFAIQNRIDFLLVDVSMPKLTGLELVESMRKYNLSFEFAVLSGYDKFDYAKKALELGAVNYLLKPVNANELLAVLQDVKQRYEQHQDNQEVKKMALAQRSKDFFEGNLDDEIIDEYHLNDTKEYSFVAVGPFENINEVVSIFNRLNDVYYFEGNVAIVLLCGDDKTREHVILNLPDAISLRRNLIIRGNPFKTLEERTDSYHHLRNRLDVLFNAFPNHGLVDVDENVQDDTNNILKINFENLDNIIKKQQFDKLEDLKNRVFSEIEHEQLSVAYKKQIATIIILAIDRSGELGSYDVAKLIQDINETDSSSLIYQKLSEFLVYVKTESNPESSKNIRLIKHYVHQNYMNEISLSTVADALQMNASYLGQIFKKETKTTFTYYLNSYRVRQAQKLLRNSKETIIDIAMMVGYSNPGYFFKIFRDIVGESPRSYRENN